MIVCKLAKATLGNRSKINWDKYAHYDAIRVDIERTIRGFENYNERIRVPGGFYLPNCNREGNFDTPSAKAHFNITNLYGTSYEGDELMMMSIRSTIRLIQYL